MSVKLVGFTGETRGLESRVAELSPVVVLVGDSGAESSAMVAGGLDWSTATLRQASIGDERFMSFTRPAVEIAEGATVWLAGAQYVRMLRSVSELSGEAFKLGAWQTLSGGFRWAFGSRRAFTEMFESIAANVAVELHKALFDPLEKSVGHARMLFDLLEASVTTPSAEHALNRALYFYEDRDRENFDWIREESVVVDGLFEDVSAFDREFSDRRRWLLDARWSEGAKVPWVPPRTRDAFRSKESDAKLRSFLHYYAQQLDSGAREEVLH